MRTWPPLKKVRLTIAFIIFGLVVSGLTAFPLLWELNLLSVILVGHDGSLNPADFTGLTHWILKVREGLDLTYRDHHFIAYGTDWLAFGHLVIALFFILPYREPARYVGVLHMGIIASLGVLPLALIAGPIRGIPFYWQLIDCSFGILCLFPLFYSLKLIKQIES